MPIWSDIIGLTAGYLRLGKAGVRLKDDGSGHLLVRNPGDSVAADATVAALRLVDTNASHTLNLTAGSNLTANRTLTLTTGDANRGLTLSGDLAVSGAATISGTHSGTSSGTNTGDVPAGTVHSFAGSTVPTGYLDCDGSAVSRSTYADLFSAIGTTWGAGNGSTTFNVPDLRGRTAIGVGQGSSLTNRTLGQTGGAETHTLTTTEMPAHTHSVPVPHGGPGGSYANLYSAADNSSNFLLANTSSVGGGGSHANMQPWAALKAIIKT